MTIRWNEVAIWWNEVAKGWNEVVWNEVVMERSGRNSDSSVQDSSPFTSGRTGYVSSGMYIFFSS